MEILIYIQLENGTPSENSLDLLSYAKEISTLGCKENKTKISVVVILPPDYNQDFDILKKYGADKLYVLKSNFPACDKRIYGKLLLKLAEEISPDIVILNSTTEGREIAPIVACGLDTGLTADCTQLEIKDNKLYSTRPTYGGKLMATILCKKNPQMATVRPNSFKKKEFEPNPNFEIKEYKFDIEAPLTEILDCIEDKHQFSNLKNAKIVLAGGMGLKNKEGFDKLKLLSELIGAKTGATRKAVDKGFIEKEAQIGQTGICVTPEIYVAFGISGAIHHIVGMENSKKIIAINTDKNAPIFQSADIGIIEDANAVLDKLIQNFSIK